MSISSKAMAITGIEDRRYWNWMPTEESRLDFNNLSLVLHSFILQNVTLINCVKDYIFSGV